MFVSTPLNAAITQLNRNNNVAACTQLNTFLRQVNADEADGQLTPQQAKELRQQATDIQRASGCSNIGVVTIPVGSSPVGIAFNPSNNDMYVANYGSTTVSVIDSSTNTVIKNIPVGSEPGQS